MAALKEIKERIRSVGGTEKITSAMRMISSAKLAKAQRYIDRMRPYERTFSKIFSDLMGCGEFDTPFAKVRKVRRVAIVAVSADGSLCGAFNANLIKQMEEIAAEYAHLGPNNTLIFPVGKKVDEMLAKSSRPKERGFVELGHKPNYAQSKALADKLMEMFLRGEVDRVELVYQHFRNVAQSEVTRECFLPVELDRPSIDDDQHLLADYIIEPDPKTVLERLMPRALALKIYTMILDSEAAEHAARMMAMQSASENAQELLDQLNLQYNKSRQQAITSELLDIVGGSFK